MPLTAKGEKIMANMKEQYGEEKGKEVFYASKNAGKITGVDDDQGEGPVSHEIAKPGSVDPGISKAKADDDEDPTGKLALAKNRFDAMIERTHSLSRRMDAIAADDRSSEEHGKEADKLEGLAKATHPAAAAGLREKAGFHREEEVRGDQEEENGEERDLAELGRAFSRARFRG